MMHEFVTYADGTLVVSSDIRTRENGEEYLIICFERPRENGFDTVIFELPSYKIIKRDGYYSDKEIEMFETVAKRGEEYFFDVARNERIQNG